MSAGGRAAAACCAGLLLLATVPAAEADDAGRRPAFRIADERVVESSGLALSRTHPGLVYTVNDSGDDPRVLVLSKTDGSVVGETTLSGAEHDDFEALAPAPGGRLVVADIGDNDAERDSVELYVIDEPGTGDADVEPRTVSLTYPDGPRDAEAAVVVGHTVFVVSKETRGSVYAASVLASARDEYTLRRVAAAPSVVTDAALLADGDVVMRDYVRAYVVELPRWRVRASYPLPPVQQGETVAAAPQGRRVYVGSEGGNSPVFVVAVPRGGEGAPGATPTVRDPTRPTGDGEPGAPRVRPSGYLTLLAAATIIGVVVHWRRRRRRGRGGTGSR